jgi:outer membrane protease
VYFASINRKTNMPITLRISFIKQILTILILTSVANVVLAQNSPPKWSLKPYVGIQQSKFDWSIAGNAAGTNPNILSELVWKNLKGPSFGLDVKYNITDRLSIKAINQYSRITKGEAEDTDYADDNRQNAFYNDKFNANKGYLFNTDLQLSYRALSFNNFSINPIVGLSYNQQRFYLLESTDSPGSIGLNSTYQTKYKGFDVGTEVVFKTKSFSVSAEILGGFYTYSAKANWNLIPDFAKPVSFTQKANSFALTGNINLSVPLNKSLQLALDYKINNIKTYSGTDRAYFTNRPGEETRFNGAKFTKNAAFLGIDFSF